MVDVATALKHTLLSTNEEDRAGYDANVVDGLFAMARALREIAASLDRLGNGGATTQFGAIEAFGMHIGEKLERLIDVLGENR